MTWDHFVDSITQTFKTVFSLFLLVAIFVAFSMSRSMKMYGNLWSIYQDEHARERGKQELKKSQNLFIVGIVLLHVVPMFLYWLWFA